MIKPIQLDFNSILYNGKCEEVIPTLEDNSIDLIITSPPYNVDLGNNKFNKNPYDLYNDNKEYDEYISWLKSIFQKVYAKMKRGGRIAINVGDPHNGRIISHVDISYFMVRDISYLPMANIIWEKSQISNRFSWGSYQSPSCPSFPKSFEYIMVFAKETLKLQDKGETDLTGEEFKQWAFSRWDITPETKMKKIGHPAVFPLEMPVRLIKMLSWKNATILDPFNGSGTTGIACKKYGRKYIGIELSPQYCEITVQRFKDTRSINELDLFESTLPNETNN